MLYLNQWYRFFEKVTIIIYKFLKITLLSFVWTLRNEATLIQKLLLVYYFERFIVYFYLFELNMILFWNQIFGKRKG